MNNPETQNETLEQNTLSPEEIAKKNAMARINFQVFGGLPIGPPNNISEADLATWKTTQARNWEYANKVYEQEIADIQNNPIYLEELSKIEKTE